MAAMSSSAPGASTTTTTTLTPPTSSHGNESAAWKTSYASGYEVDDSMQDRHLLNEFEPTNGAARRPLSHHDSVDYDPFAKPDPNDPFPATKEIRSGGRSTSRSDNKRSNPQATDSEKVYSYADSKWIHRDKLAKIENAELQAAGIVLPKSRSQSRPRRERSAEKMNGRRGTDASDHQPMPRSRKNSTQRSASAERSPELESSAWDLRMPEEIAEDPNEYWISSDTLAGHGSRIPVAKQSPAPIPADYLDRDHLVPRKMSGTLLPDEEFMLAVSKPRSRGGSMHLDAPALQPAKRSATEGSPRKTTTTATRKPSSATAKTTTAGRPRTRNGLGRDAGTTTRPTTRSGELSPKAPEGEPPWMISAYKPDPRLPPDQQLLPTVARRLQQEQWEREGKFGSVYDKDFRPLTDDFDGVGPPELQKSPAEEREEWPLRADALRSDTLSPTPSRPGTSSYSTMPRIQDTPMISPLASPRLPNPQPHLMQTTRVPTEPVQPPPQMSEKEKKKSGCGCCVVM